MNEFIELTIKDSNTKIIERISSIHNIVDGGEFVRIWFYDPDNKEKVLEEGSDFVTPYQEIHDILIREYPIEVINER